MAIQLVVTGACNFGFDWWYLFGTYGPLILPNQPVGYKYQYRYRDSSTGAKSVPGPLTRYELFPIRESVIITPATTNQAGVDEIDNYRIGGTITTSPLYVASCENIPSNPQVCIDTLPDLFVLEVNQPPDLTALQPWPTLIGPLQGTCTVVGTTVTWVSGDKFPLNMLSNTIIQLNGKAYLTQGNPASDTQLSLTQDAGYLASANFLIASPTLAGTALPFAFGPLEGPFAPVVFALGDNLNGGTLYFSNFSDADSASDANTLEFGTPGHDLVSGDVWNGMAFAGSREAVYAIRFSYLTTIGASNNNSFQWTLINSPSGMWSRWACCATPIGVAFLGRDGIYIATEGGAVSISDGELYPLFPHDGQAAGPTTIGDNIILPVDMTDLTHLVMTYCDESIRFCYKYTGGNFNTLIYEIYKKRWLLNNYSNAILRHYLVEPSAEKPNDQEILMLAFDNHIMLSGGDEDDLKPINSLILTPAMDGGDDRTQKLYVDGMFDVDGNGPFTVEALGTDGQYKIVLSDPIQVAAFRKQYLVNLVTGQESTPCGGGGTVIWQLTSTPPDGVRTQFSFSEEPNFCSWNGLNQFKDKGFTLSQSSGSWLVEFIGEGGAVLTPGIGDDIRAEIS
jgi:hypothetical protein